MVAQWAEKELRNLKRIKQFIPCPEVFEVRQNVLVMGFLGKDGEAAPRLKDVTWLEPEQWQEVYIQMCLMMRTLTQKAKLVHGDLSEYNLLWHNSQIYMIDVSQSVECDHPHAFDFLKRDCININDFFEKCGCATVDIKSLFDYIITEKLGADEEDRIVDLLEQAKNRGPCHERDVEEQIFINTWIPSHLSQMSDLKEIDKEMKKRDRGEETLYDGLIASGKVKDKPTEIEEESDDENPSEDDACSEKSDGSADTITKEILSGHKPEGMSQKEWKKAVKEANKEKRKNKTPKHVKKKKEKKHR
jgi:RIO kinase 1